MTVQRANIIGILGGSFNPVHIGHLMLASYLCQWNYVDKVWLMLSPRNPLKDSRTQISDIKRLNMLHRATKNIDYMQTCDIELSMPRPSYTINTLNTLAHRYPDKQFKLIIGSDNWAIFEKWKSWQEILDRFGVIVYPRRGYPIDNHIVDGMEVADAPIVDISSTFIRSAIAAGRNVEFFLPQGVYKYILDNKLYKSQPKL
jgi:nicotinate-nucleotide adenylyltransferase